MQHNKLGISPAFSQFSASNLSLEEIHQFYNLDSISLPADRPYLWSNSVASLDGITSLERKDGEGATSPKIALSGLSDDSSSDWKLLNAGWCFADAVLTTGSILRSEPDTIYAPSMPDLQTFRKETLKKETDIPLNVILTASGNLPLSHPIITSAHVPAVILIPTGAKQSLLSRFESLGEPDSSTNFNFQGYSSTIHFFKNTNLFIADVKTQQDNSGFLDLKHALAILRHHFSIKYLDVTAGSVTLGALISSCLLDEYRLTRSACFLGAAENRSNLMAFSTPFTFPNIPLLCYEGVRMGHHCHHMFLRCSIDYSKVTSAE